MARDGVGMDGCFWYVWLLLVQMLLVRVDIDRGPMLLLGWMLLIGLDVAKGRCCL